MRAPRLLVPLLVALATLAACSKNGGGDGAADRPKVAFVTNGIASFWTIANAGVRAAAEEFAADAEFKAPNDVADQKRIVEELLTLGVDGIAISPIDGVNQASLIDEACDRTRVITHDSDAPGTKRLCYVGMDNYTAGRECGKLLKEAMPGGGSVMLFVGRMEQDNAKLRRQGIVDELLDRPADRTRFDPPGEVLAGERYTILDTRTDQFDTSRAKANAEDALALHPDLDAMIGLFEYNTPACLEALQTAGKLGAVAVVGFDENDRTLQGILDGHVHGTVTQQPYRYGYESVRILAGLARGEDVLPEGGFLDVPARVVRKEDCRAFRDELKRLVEGGS